jgi:hypothetical protein
VTAFRFWREGLILVLVAALGVQTWRIDRLKAEPVKAENHALKAAAKKEHKADGVTARIGETSAATVSHIEYRTRTLIQKVPVYVTPATDARFGNLPWGFVRLHVSAVSGVDPVSIAPGEPDDAPSTVAVSNVLAVDVSNAGSCRADQARMSELQDWIRQQQAVAEEH